jgi:DNA-binding NarL/FixJ family response regulator
VVVDDHPIVRRGLRDLICREPDLEVCGEAGDAIEAARLVQAADPDLVLVDLSLPAGHGIELIRQLRLSGSRAKMLVVSMHDESLFAERVLRAGAMGYVNKQEADAVLLGAIREVLAGRIYLSHTLSGRVLHNILYGPSVDEDPIQALSNRELQVFEMIGQGLAAKNIAVKLQLSRKTVEAHREKIKAKLNLGSSTELGWRAIQWVLEGPSGKDSP